jgi:hypothetical protein
MTFGADRTLHFDVFEEHAFEEHAAEVESQTLLVERKRTSRLDNHAAGNRNRPAPYAAIGAAIVGTRSISTGGSTVEHGVGSPQAVFGASHTSLILGSRCP